MFSFASLNVERDKHIQRWVLALKRHAPDVMHFQEFPIYLIGHVREALELPYVYYENNCFSSNGSGLLEGTATFSRYPIISAKTYYLGGQTQTLETTAERRLRNTPLLVTTIEKQGEQIVFGNTHLPVTFEGEVTPEQTCHVEDLLTAVAHNTSIVFSGDFNAPRGRESFDTIAHKYCDAIPQEYLTSIDGSLHRRGPLPYMVDGLFHTPDISITHVRLVDGLSDHMGIVASIEKA
jgi:endonuclease/exonuclease/phosphatase (EEP) superfamily protein YafD